jgi:hypothetical protein
MQRSIRVDTNPDGTVLFISSESFLSYFTPGGREPDLPDTDAPSASFF